MVNYIRGFAKADTPDLRKKVAERPIEGIQKAEFVAAGRRQRRSTRPSERQEVVPKTCQINVTDNRIDEVYQELRTLKLKSVRNAIAVLLCVFLELSIDHFLENNGGTLNFTAPGGREQFKKLNRKLTDVVAMLISTGVPKDHFKVISRSLEVKSSPMNIDLFHLYVHNRFATPSPQELTAAWDNAQPLFEKLWP